MGDKNDVTFLQKKNIQHGDQAPQDSQLILPWELPLSLIKNKQRLDLLFAVLFGYDAGGENSSML